MIISQFRSALIVDDSRSQSMLEDMVCREVGIETVYAAENGLEGLERARAVKPDLILLDLEMPVMDGVEVLQAMAREALAIPLVVTSAKDLRLLNTVELMGRELGLPVLGALSKPVTAPDLADLLARCRRVSPHPDMVSAREVRDALDQGRVVAYFQPKVDLRDSAVKGCEVLARMFDAGGNVVGPDRFVPVLEAQGWGTELTMAMLDQALAAWKIWHAKGIDLVMSVNISPRSLTGNRLVGEIERRVREAGVPPAAILFEITETAVADTVTDAMAITARLRLAGFGLSIDDFGTGFATVQQLRRFPFTELKVDKSLVTAIAQKPHLAAIFDGVVQLARQLSLTSVAEGVETAADLEALKAHGCEVGQGFLFAQPMPASDLPVWVGNRRLNGSGQTASARPGR
ncbi:EAL domain-containing response regulator [Paludibacterium paludis]|uniref:Transcriptional regulator n=1 Tax=Paludibacterium paludis TaxID=1225769 RepID=A0A918P1B2_9NEIS|nr:EAL domain-containing protein [Paludibacterium paludis]GGY13173.1 transcriptional regulator [Paludibacterium paludis]